MRLGIRYRFPGPGMVRIADDLMAPGEYGITVDDEALPYVVELDVVLEDQRPSCKEIRCIRRPGGPPVTSEGIREIPVSGILRHTLQDVAYRVDEISPGQYKLTPVSKGNDIEATYQAARRRFPLTDDRLEKAALLYQEAEARGDPPTKNVAEAMHVSRSTAARLVREARKRGHLPERGKP